MRFVRFGQQGARLGTGRLLACFATAALCVAGLLPAATAGGAGAGLGVMVPAHPGQLLPRSNATTDSLNWSGYVDLPSGTHKVTNVTSTWIVPKVNGTTSGFGATWTGIGGYNTSDLIQAGTSEEYITGLGASYNAWYEILPASETPISGCSGDSACTVRPGDKVTVTITAGAIQQNQPWTISIVDANHWTYSINLNYQSTYSSAEYILEAPTVGAQTVMPMMQTTLFDPDTFAVDGGAAQTIAQGSPVMVTMNQREGLPSALDSDGDGFNACAYKLTCAAPASS